MVWVVLHDKNPNQKMKKQILTLLGLTVICMAACKKNQVETVKPVITYPAIAEAADPAILFTAANNVKVYNGGFGSALAVDPNQPGILYDDRPRLKRCGAGG